MHQLSSGVFLVNNFVSTESKAWIAKWVSATQKSSVPTTVHNLYIWWSQLPTATATATHPHFYFIHIAPHFKASHTWGMLTSKVDYSLMCKGQKLSDQPVLILVPAGEPYTRQPVRQFTHMVYFCPKLFLSWVALKVANGFLLLLLKQNTSLNIYTQKRWGKGS